MKNDIDQLRERIEKLELAISQSGCICYEEWETGRKIMNYECPIHNKPPRTFYEFLMS